jgi:hypothetical protein
MAATPQGARLTEQHRIEQQQVRAQFLAEFIALWALLDSTRLDETSPGWVRAVLRLIGVYRTRSAQVSISYYGAFAETERPGGAPQLIVPRSLVRDEVTVPVPMPVRARNRLDPVVSRRDTRTATTRPASNPAPASPSATRRDTNPVPRRSSVTSVFDDPVFADRPQRRTRIEIPDIDWTPSDRAAKVSLEVTGPAAQKSKTSRGKPLVVVRDESFTAASGAASRHVLTGGRRSLLTLLEADPQAVGWARVTDGDPCAFCAMLASRGVVYGSEAAAGFSAHDHCACTAEPAYSRAAPLPGRGQEFKDLWNAEIRGKYSGEEARRQWRRLYEQRLRDQRRSGVA